MRKRKQARRDVWVGAASILAAVTVTIWATKHALLTETVAWGIFVVAIYIVVALIWDFPLPSPKDSPSDTESDFSQPHAEYMKIVESWLSTIFEEATDFTFRVQYNCYVGVVPRQDQTIRKYETTAGPQVALRGQILNVTSSNNSPATAERIQPDASPANRVKQLTVHEGEKLRMAIFFDPRLEPGESLHWEFREKWPNRFGPIREHGSYSWSAALPSQCTKMSITFHIPIALGVADFASTPQDALVNKTYVKDICQLSCTVENPTIERVIVSLTVHSGSPKPISTQGQS